MLQEEPNRKQAPAVTLRTVTKLEHSIMSAHYNYLKEYSSCALELRATGIMFATYFQMIQDKVIVTVYL